VTQIYDSSGEKLMRIEDVSQYDNTTWLDDNRVLFMTGGSGVQESIALAYLDTQTVEVIIKGRSASSLVSRGDGKNVICICYEEGDEAESFCQLDVQAKTLTKLSDRVGDAKMMGSLVLAPDGQDLLGFGYTLNEGEQTYDMLCDIGVISLADGTLKKVYHSGFNGSFSSMRGNQIVLNRYLVGAEPDAVESVWLFDFDSGEFRQIIGNATQAQFI
jgi:hypothetical protein